MTYYGYISDHSFSSKSALFVVLSHSYPISGLEDSLKITARYVIQKQVGNFAFVSILKESILYLLLAFAQPV
jgi:SpoU rRNA methylase family enzyme